MNSAFVLVGFLAGAMIAFMTVFAMVFLLGRCLVPAGAVCI